MKLLRIPLASLLRFILGERHHFLVAWPGRLARICGESSSGREARATVGVLFLPLALLLIAAPQLDAFQEADPAPRSERKLEEGFEWIFDGKTLEGWEGNLKWFRVEEGAIVAGTLEGKIPHNEFLCTRRTYGDFELKLEAKLRGEGDNAGIQFRTKRIPNNTEVSGYQCDMGRAWNRNVWGCLYDESRRNKMLAEIPDEKLKEWVKTGDWNEFTVRAVGSKIEIFLNGNRTITYEEKEDSIDRAGVIGLQIHSGPPTEALYRNIRIKVLGKD